MSYCVHCGVELADSEHECPLCGTPVYDPSSPTRLGHAPFPTPREKETPEVKTSGVFLILTFIFMLPLLLSLVCDLSISGRVSWSGYVMGGVAVAYFIIVPPCCWHMNPAWFVTIDYAAIAAFLSYIEHRGGGNWFGALCLPLLSIAAAFIVLIIIWTRRRRRGILAIASLCLFSAGVFTLIVEWRLIRTFGSELHFTWSLYPFISCSLFAAILAVINQNEHLKEKLRRKLFI